jgi:hypothetical protein
MSNKFVSDFLKDNCRHYNSESEAEEHQIKYEYLNNICPDFTTDPSIRVYILVDYDFNIIKITKKDKFTQQTLEFVPSLVDLQSKVSFNLLLNKILNDPFKVDDLNYDIDSLLNL